jgi:hypothetical protein
VVTGGTNIAPIFSGTPVVAQEPEQAGTGDGKEQHQLGVRGHECRDVRGYRPDLPKKLHLHSSVFHRISPFDGGRLFYSRRG